MKNISTKISRVVSEMANYHHNRDNLGLEGEKLTKANGFFCFVECVTPPPDHPTDKESLSMEFMLEVRTPSGGFKQVFWIDDKGELTESPDDAKRISTGWSFGPDSRAELRNLSFAGIRKCKEVARANGVPENAKIYDNLP